MSYSSSPTTRLAIPASHTQHDSLLWQQKYVSKKHQMYMYMCTYIDMQLNKIKGYIYIHMCLLLDLYQNSTWWTVHKGQHLLMSSLQKAETFWRTAGLRQTSLNSPHPATHTKQLCCYQLHAVSLCSSSAPGGEPLSVSLLVGVLFEEDWCMLFQCPA